MQRGNPGHGCHGWLSTNLAKPGICLSDNKTCWMLKAAASLLGAAVNSVADLRATLAQDLDDGKVERGTEKGLFNVPLNMNTYSTSEALVVISFLPRRDSSTQRAGSQMLEGSTFAWTAWPHASCLRQAPPEQSVLNPWMDRVSTRRIPRAGVQLVFQEWHSRGKRS